MDDIKNVAVSAWNMEKWLSTVNAERKMEAKNYLYDIYNYLKKNNVEVLDITGFKYTPELAVNVINDEIIDADCDELIITEMVRPIILEKRKVVEFGQVIIGRTAEQTRENKMIEMSLSKGGDTTSNAPKDVKENLGSPRRLRRNKKSRLSLSGIALIFVMCSILLGMFLMHNNNIEQANELLEIKQEIILMEEKLDDIKKVSEETNTVETKDVEIEYEIRAGDCLYSICDDNDIDFNKYYSKIVKMNGLENPNELNIGQIIYLPVEYRT